MPIESATLVIIASLFVLMLAGIPLGVVTLTVSIVTALAYFGPAGLGLVGRQIVGVLEHYSFVAVPLFVLMASVMEKAGVGHDLFDAMAEGSLHGMLDAAGVEYDRNVELNPYSLLPKWVHPRKTA